MVPDPKAWMWFFSSYAPLWIMLGLRFSNTAARICLIAFGAICIGYVAIIICRSVGERPSNTTLIVTGDAGADVSGYLASYLLPFLTVPAPSLTDVIAYVIFVLVAGLVYVRSGLMQINPTVYFMGRRVVRATVPVRDSGKEVFVISGRDLRVSESLQAERLSDRVYIDHATGG